MKPVELRAKDLRQFAILPIRAIKDPRIRGQTLRVLAAYCSYCDFMGRTFVSQLRIAQDVGMTRSGVSNHVRILRDLGYMVYANPLWRGQRSTSNRVVYDVNVKLEQTIRSRLSSKQQMQIAEAEHTAIEQHKLEKAGANSEDVRRLSMLYEDFQLLVKNFFISSIAQGYWVSYKDQGKAAISLSAQAVGLLKIDRERGK